ncbi:MAG: hypothetical protein ACI8ZM_005163 [Crocinitomix sp.]|jgi:hypothetical protein
MKAIIVKIISTSFVFIALPFTLSAQTFEIYEQELGEPVGEDISGTIIEVSVDPFGDADIDFLAVNVSDAVVNIRLERFKIVDATGSIDYCRFGPSTFESVAYSSALVSVANPFISRENHDIEIDQLADFGSYYLSEESSGCSHYRYYIIDETDARLDSIDVRYCSTLGIDDASNPKISVFPNPATHQFKIDYSSELKKGTGVILTNILGEQVL